MPRGETERELAPESATCLSESLYDPNGLPEPEDFHNLVMALTQPYSTIVMLAGLSGLSKGEIEAVAAK